MTNFIAIIPLKVVVFPNENLNIHVKEPKYIQLIQECIADKKQFGILPEIEDNHQATGTLMEIVEVARVYADNSLDIRIRGIRVFHVLEHIPAIPDKLFSGAIVAYPENNDIKISPSLTNLIIEEVMRLFVLLNLGHKFPKDKTEWVSYDIAHTIGFSLQQEYELLTILNEIQRMEYIRRQLKSMDTVVEELESLKARIMLNGHFRTLT